MFAFKLHQISRLICKYSRHYFVYDTICYKFFFLLICQERHKPTIPANIKSLSLSQSNNLPFVKIQSYNKRPARSITAIVLSTNITYKSGQWRRVGIASGKLWESISLSVSLSLSLSHMCLC